MANIHWNHSFNTVFNTVINTADSAIDRVINITINALAVKQGEIIGLEQMKQGQATRRVTTEALQGEGSWVLVSAPTHEEVEETRAFSDAHEQDDNWAELVDVHNQRFLAAHILAWNWADERGQPLPLPKDDPSVIDGILVDEYHFLCGLF